MTRTTRLFAALIALLTIAAPATAYWEFGHETVAEIAMLNVKPSTRAAVRALLRHSDLLDTPECPATTIEGASTWADCVKKLKNPDGTYRFSFAYTWHFQDVDVCKPFELETPCKDGDCVSAQIERDVKLLRDTHLPLKDRVQALVFLIHFVGDLHQPLHAGEHGDQGGNKISAGYGIYAPERFNLHSIWDGPLAERAITTPPSIVRHYSPAEKAKMQAGTVTDWSRESWRVSREVVYASALGDAACGPTPTARVALDNAEIEKLVPAARLQVERGGLRLAKLLDEALG